MQVLPQPKTPTHAIYKREEMPMAMPLGAPRHYAVKRQICRGGLSVYLPLCGARCVSEQLTTKIEECTCKACIGELLHIAYKIKIKKGLEDEEGINSDGIYS